MYVHIYNMCVIARSEGRRSFAKQTGPQHCLCQPSSLTFRAFFENSSQGSSKRWIHLRALQFRERYTYVYLYIYIHMYMCIINLHHRSIRLRDWGIYTILLYYTILYYTILDYTILYYTILYYTILYHTILYHTRLYHTILDSTVQN